MIASLRGVSRRELGRWIELCKVSILFLDHLLDLVPSRFGRSAARP